ncbi:MAG: pentapeptide repeat-containing protein [Clostridium saudiense]|uniref:Ion transport 2 domain-containing protein n=1 Tax=Clostridium disporicum TaxID=84024 RepID=A0A174GE53_9CLOT|nr:MULTISPECIES: pentapeptide repeat-containing protein [Clostridium]CUO59190.1 Ion transport 2 domain-containing protein [Clostridium disporicum]
MGYINFKEEKYKAKNQLKNRRDNNKNLFNELVKSRDLPNTYIPDKEYSFKEFNDKHFGGGKILGEEEFIEIVNSDIICSIFTNCTFGNIKFKECSFIGCKFYECNFESGGVIFENCTFLKEESEKKPSLNRFDNFSCEFYKCNIYAKFDGCILGYLIFDKCLIHNSFFNLSDMSSLMVINSEFKRIRIEDCDLSGAKIIDTYIIDLDFTDKMKTKFDQKTFFDKIKFREKNRDEYEGIYMTYETVADKFKENSLNNNFGEYYYLAKKTERKTLDFFPRIGSYLYWATSGYGERPINAIVFSLIMMAIFGVLYSIFGIEVKDNFISLVKYNIHDYNGVLDCLRQGFILSINLFSGVGANESIPVKFSEIIASFEIMFGVIMMGIGTGVVVRKLVR